jgi:hypothetical protein
MSQRRRRFVIGVAVVGLLLLVVAGAIYIPMYRYLSFGAKSFKIESVDSHWSLDLPQGSYAAYLSSSPDRHVKRGDGYRVELTYADQTKILDEAAVMFTVPRGCPPAEFRVLSVNPDAPCYVIIHITP